MLQVFFKIIVALLGYTVSLAAEIKEEPSEDWKTRLEYARVLSYMQRYDESLIEFQRLIKERPDDEVKLEMAKVYYYQKKYSEALNLIEAIPPEKRSKETDLLLADIFLIQKDYYKAEKLFKKSLSALPEKRDFITYRLAEMLSWQKRYDESLKLYRELIERNPKDIQLRRKYAMVLLWAGKDKEAAEELKATLDPSS